MGGNLDNSEFKVIISVCRRLLEYNKTFEVMFII